MLAALTIRDVVLVEALDLAFDRGLVVLTGETGTGKSILLDALGLALGARADSGLVRRGADRAVVGATFVIDRSHPARALLEEQELPADDEIVLRRQVGADGRSRAFVNDAPVSGGLLRQLGALLVEMQDQMEVRGLFDPAQHRALLDAYGQTDGLRREVAACWRAWRAAADAEARAGAEAEAARREEEWLRHSVEELAALAPREGEEAELVEARTRIAARERLLEALAAAAGELGSGRGVVGAIGAAERILERAADRAGDLFEPALAALGRAAAEAADALDEIERARDRLADAEAPSLEAVDDRLHALRAAARKHGVAVENLEALASQLAERLASAETAGDALARLARERDAARAVYVEAAARLRAARERAARALDGAVARELPPLRLERARFRTGIAPLEEADWGPEGSERIAFEASTNPGAPFAPLARVASGGELARFMLALKVALAELGSAGTLVFDEVDAGIGGATADAVGDRLARLAARVQVLVVTHSPQVAARARQHFSVAKVATAAGGAATLVTELDPEARREEIARMLSGAEVTDAARAAAESLVTAAAR